MATFAENLRILITADSAGAIKGIEGVGRAADKNLSKAEKSIDRMGSRLTTVGAGMVAFGAVAAYGLGQAAQSAGELEQAVGGSDAVFQEASGTIDRYARNAADKVGLSERAYRESTTLIGTHLRRMGFEVDDAAERSNDLVDVGADLAAQYGGTTAQAVEALGAAFRGEADPAERFGLDLRASAVAAEAVALGLAESTSAVDDHARAQALLSLIAEQSADALGANAREADTLQGRQMRLAASFEDLKASIGEGVLPVMETLFGVAQGGIKTFQGLNDATGGLVGQAATWATIGTLGVGGLSLLAGGAIKARDNFKELGRVAQSARARIAGMSGVLGPVGVAGASLAAAIGIAEFLKASNEREILKSAEAFAKLDEVTRDSAEATDLLNNAVKVSTIDFTASNSAAQEFAETGTLTEQALEDLDGGFQSLIDKAPELTQRYIDNAEAMGAPVELLNQWRRELAGKIGQDAEAVSAQDEYTGAVEEAAGATRDATDALDAYRDGLDDLIDRYLSVEEASDNLIIAFASAEEHFAKQQEEAGRAGLALDGNTEAAARNRDVLRGLVDDGVDVITTMAEQGATSEELRAEVGRQKDRLRELADRYGLNQDVVDDYIEILSRVPTDIDTFIDVDSNASKVVKGVLSSINRVPKFTTAYVDVVRRAGRDLGGGPTLHREHGGRVTAGRAYIVGERRPELLVPDADGTILPAVPPMAMAGGWAGGATYIDQRTFNITTGADQNAVVEAIKRYERSNGPLPVRVRG